MQTNLDILAKDFAARCHVNKVVVVEAVRLKLPNGNVPLPAVFHVRLAEVTQITQYEKSFPIAKPLA